MRRRIRQPNPAGCPLALTPDGRTLATSDNWDGDHLGQNTIRLFDVEAGEQVLALEPGNDRVGVMVFSPDGGRLFTGLDRGFGIVWDVSRGQGARRAKE
jgi:WD40 repeat protein